MGRGSTLKSFNWWVCLVLELLTEKGVSLDGFLFFLIDAV